MQKLYSYRGSEIQFNLPEEKADGYNAIVDKMIKGEPLSQQDDRANLVHYKDVSAFLDHLIEINGGRLDLVRIESNLSDYLIEVEASQENHGL